MKVTTIDVSKKETFENALWLDATPEQEIEIYNTLKKFGYER